MECPADETLFAMLRGDLDRDGLRRLDTHLDSCDSCRETMVVLARSAGSAPDAKAGESESEGGGERDFEEELVPARGVAMGRFLVIEPIGRGAMGVVLSAYDPELDRKVAIKLLRPDHDGDRDEARGRLVREAQAMARLSHPNVVTVYEVGAWHQAVFVAMELVEGVTLRDWLGQSNRNIDSILGVFAQAGEGLAAAHAAGLVHRDFKPENVVVGADGRVRVTDFGLAGMGVNGPAEIDLAQSIVASGKGDTGVGTSQVVTRAGALLGTPAYMAPEQLAGAVADARADQFAFAVALYEALYGQRPFTGRTLRELRSAIESASFARSSSSVAIPRRVAGAIPRRVAMAIRRALSARPEDRFPSVHELLAALRVERKSRLGVAVLGGAVVVLAGAAIGFAASRDDAPSCSEGAALVGTVWSPTVASAVTRRLDVAGAGGAIARTVVSRVDRWAAAFAAASDSVCRATRIERTQSEAVMDARTACLRRQLVDAEAIVGELTTANPQLQSAAPELVSALPDPSACADVSSLAAMTPLPSNPGERARIERLRAAVANMRASVLAASGRATQVDGATALVRDAVAIGYPPLLVEARLVLVLALRSTTRADDAERAAREALFAAEASRDDIGAARAWLALVGIEGERGHYEEAARMAEHARAAVARAGSPLDLEASLLNVVGVASEALGRHDEARSALERALVLRRRLVGNDDPEVARVLTNLGNAARARGAVQEALRIHREALAIDQAALGPSHPAVARHLHNLGGVLRLLGRPEEALLHYRRALAIRESTFGPSHPETAITHNSLGLVSLDLARADEARAHFDVALATLSAAGHAEEAVARHNLGLLDQHAGNHSGAVAHLTRAMALEERLLGDRHEKVATIALELATSLLALGRDDEARVVIARAETIGEQLGQTALVGRARALRPPPPRALIRRAPEIAPVVAMPSAPTPAVTGPVVRPPRRPSSGPGSLSPNGERVGVRGDRRPNPPPNVITPPQPRPAAPPGGLTYTPGRAW